MKPRLVLLLLMLFMAVGIFGQDAAPTATPRRRGWLGRILHPFSPEVVPQYKDPKLRGLALDLQITPQTVKLSEVRQLGIKVTLGETISTRELTPNKVFIAEVFFPQYPELRVRQKFLAVP